jgi:hypothetical protein
VALGEPPAAQYGFTFPADQQYADAMGTAIHGLYENGEDYLASILYESAFVSAQSLRLGIESAAGGVDLGTLAMRGMFPGLAKPIRGVMTGLVNDALDIVIEATSREIAEAVVAGLEVVPVLGTIIRSILGTILLPFLNKGPTAEEQLAQCLKEKLAPACKQWAQQFEPVPTSIEPLPSDFFRTAAYAYSNGTRPPMTCAALIVGLCGDEADGWLFDARSYEQMLSNVRGLPGPEDADDCRQKTRFTGGWAECMKQAERDKCAGRWSIRGHGCDRGVGIPRETRRKMWRLVKAIFADVQEPTTVPVARSHEPDGGRTVMPLLQDILLREWNEGRINRNLLQSIESVVLANYTKSCCVYQGYPWEKCSRDNCVGYTDLVSPLVGRARDSSQASAMGDSLLVRWRNATQAGIIGLERQKEHVSALAKVAGKLTVTSKDAKQLAETVRRAAPKRSWVEYGLIGGATLGAATLTFMGVSALVPKRRN